jgi:hypothetical protein
VPTTSSARAALLPALLVLAATCALLSSAVALAGPAAAIEDPRRPTAEVTHGPSCGPSVIRVAVTNGTEVHRVTLVLDRTDEQEAAELGNGEQAELVSEDIDWGRTVDVSVTVTDTDGTAEQPIEFGTYTRPSAEDCAAVTPTTSPSSPEPTTPAAPPSTGTTTTPTSPSSEPAPATPATTAATATTATTATTSSTPSRPSSPSTPRPTGSAPASPGTPHWTPPPSSPAGQADGSGDEPRNEPRDEAGSASAASVSPGGVLTVRATGFTPGEPVTVSMVGIDHPLTTVTAAVDGSVEAVVQIPRSAALGTATVQLVGGQSAASAGLDLQVAARAQPVAERTSLPVFVAGTALIGAAGVLGLMAARRSRASHTTTPR